MPGPVAVLELPPLPGDDEDGDPPMPKHPVIDSKANKNNMGVRISRFIIPSTKLVSRLSLPRDYNSVLRATP
jgi:hypothetical protein